MQQNDSWFRRNWLALAAGGYFLGALLHGLKWFMFRNEDRAIDAGVALFCAVTFTFQYREHNSIRQYREAMQKVKQERETASRLGKS